MAIEIVRDYLKQYGLADSVIELKQSSATVELAAQALHTQPERIAKTLSFMGSDGAILVVCAGDCKIDNHAFKVEFGVKAKMLKPEEVEQYTNHQIGGVCPFAVPETTKIYLDESMKRFETIFPACGSSNSAIELTMVQLEETIPFVKWVDVCKGWKE